MKLISSNKKSISILLIILVFIGGASALLALAWPLLGIAALKFIDGAPDNLTLTDYITQFLLGLLPAVPVGLMLGGLSAIAYSFLDPENKTYMRVFGSVLLLIFVVFTYQYLR